MFEYAKSISYDVESYINLEYLSEKKLGIELNRIFSDSEFIHNKIVPDSGLRTRPDFRNDKMQLIVEFDGPRHFTVPKVILTDFTKDKVYTSMGYKVVRIPYFIQLDVKTVKKFFGINGYYSETPIFPHGFITKSAILPACFCSLGIQQFSYWFEEFLNNENDCVGEFHWLRNLFLQIDYHDRHPLEIVPLGLYNKELFDALYEHGYPT